MICISSELDFLRDSESEVRNLIPPPMTPHMAIFQGNLDPRPISCWSVYHLDRIFDRDSESGVRNSKFHLWHLIWPYLCFSHILEEIGPPPIMMIYTSHDFGVNIIMDSPNIARLQILGEIRPPPIMMIYISSGPDFHRDSESEARNLKFHLWHHIVISVCF